MENESKKFITIEPVHCPDCSTKQEMIRMPVTLPQIIFGGWTCPECGCQMDRFGVKLSEKK